MKNSIKQKELENQASLTSKEIYKGRVFSLQCDTLQFKNEPAHDWDIIIHPGAVAAIPVNQAGKLILIQQWRRATKEIIYELPAGVLEPAESPLSCIQRELQEEIGYRADTIIPLGGFYTAPGFCNEYIHLFIAKDLSPSSLPGDAHEAIDVVEMDLTEALHLIDSNAIKDAKTIAGIFRYTRWLENG